MGFTEIVGGSTRNTKCRTKKKTLEVIDQKTSLPKEIRLRKNRPRGCLAPKRICTRCQTAVIHKLSRFYDSKICEGCTEKTIAASGARPEQPGVPDRTGSRLATEGGC